MRANDEGPTRHREPTGRRHRHALGALAAGLAVTATLGLTACGPDAGANEAAEGDEAAEYASPAERTTTNEPRVLHESSFETADGIELDVDGTLEVADRNGALELIVDLEGLPPGEHAWHIHEGACDEAGPIRLPLSSTSDMEGTVGPVTVDAEGRVDRTVRVPGLNRAWVDAGDHSLHIHERPGTDHGPTLVCAEI